MRYGKFLYKIAVYSRKKPYVHSKMTILCGYGRRERIDWRACCYSFIFRGCEPETDGNGIIDFLHKYVVNMSHLFSQPCFIDGTYLLEEDHGILYESEALGIDVDMRR